MGRARRDDAKIAEEAANRSGDGQRPSQPVLALYPPSPWAEVQARALALVTAFSDPALAATYLDLFEEAAGDLNDARATVEVMVLFTHRLVAELAARSDVPTTVVRSGLAEPIDFLTAVQEIL